MDAVESVTAESRAAALEAALEVRTRELQAATEQRMALVHELDHRVKNNLQLVSCLLQMQARRAQDATVRAALDSMLERLHAIGTVHRRLFQREDLSWFDVSDFVRDLVGEAAAAAERRHIRFACDLTPVEAPARVAGPIALLVNELLSNAVHHAFPDGRPGRIWVRVGRDEQGIRIEIADDGVGMGGPDGKLAGDGSGFGLTIVDLLSRQLQARIRREGPPGLRTEVTLPPAFVRG